MALRFTPVDTTFYDLFAAVGQPPGRRGGPARRDARRRQRPRGPSPSRCARPSTQADETTHEIIRRVNSTFVTPFDREDIYALASSLDDVMDFMEEAVDLVLLYEVDDLPTELRRRRSRCSSGAPS